MIWIMRTNSYMCTRLCVRKKNDMFKIWGKWHFFWLFQQIIFSRKKKRIKNFSFIPSRFGTSKMYWCHLITSLRNAYLNSMILVQDSKAQVSSWYHFQFFFSGFFWRKKPKNCLFSHIFLLDCTHQWIFPVTYCSWDY